MAIKCHNQRQPAHEIARKRHRTLAALCQQEHNWNMQSGPEDINLFPGSTQLSVKFQLLIKTKILTNEDVSCLKPPRSCTVKPVLSGHSERTTKLVFNTDYRLMQVKSIAECSPWSILQYFRPSLSYNFPLRPLFCLFLSGRLRQGLLYLTC